MKQEIINRFTSYVKVDTQSDASSESTPSTPGQLTLANMLVEELKQIGMEEVTIDDNGYVMATLPSNTEKDVPVIGFLAHVDTATDFTGTNVKPQIVENYDGEAIILNEKLHIELSPKDFPSLKDYKGHTLITTDGTTLLGADNKAGIAEIMTAMKYLIDHPEIKHGKIRHSHRMRRSAVVRISSMCLRLALNLPTRWTAGLLASWNMKASMRQMQSLKF